MIVVPKSFLGFQRPFSSLILDSGKLLVADYLARELVLLDLQSEEKVSITQNGRNGSVLGPHCVTYSNDHHWIFVTDYLGKKILKFTADLKFHSVFLDHETLKPHWLLTGPATLRIDANNHHYVCDYGSNSIQIFSEQGSFLGFMGKNSEGIPAAGKLPGEFDRVHDVLFLPDGGLIVVDTWNSRLQKFSNDRSQIDHIETGFELPVAIDGGNDLFVISDVGNSTVTLFNSKTFEKIQSWSDFLKPYDVRMNLNSLWVCDSDNRRIQMIHM